MWRILATCAVSPVALMGVVILDLPWPMAAMDQATGGSVLQARPLSLADLLPPSRAGPLLLRRPGGC